MKRNVRIIALCLVMLMIMTVLTACGDREKFVGTWIQQEGENIDAILVLSKNGEGSMTTSGGSINVPSGVKWSIDKNKLYISYSACGMSETREYSYKFSGNKMILTESDGTVTIYVKQ